MPLMKWSEEFSVNVKAIDEQHKRWIEILNELHDAMRAGKGNEILGNVFDELLEYTRVHFTTEERIMQAAGYPLFLGHRKIHEDMVKELNQLVHQYKSGEPVMTVDVMQLLKNWLSEHIMGMDKNFGPYLNSKGIY